MKTHNYYLIFLLLILYSKKSYCQTYPRMSYKGNLKNPRLIILKNHTNSLKDSLTKKYLPKLYKDKNSDLEAILAFDKKNRTINLFKVVSLNKEYIYITKGDSNTTRLIANDFKEISNAFKIVKTEVFKELLYANGKSKITNFNKLFINTRGDFGLLNITKLNNEIINNPSQYKLLIN